MFTDAVKNMLSNELRGKFYDAEQKFNWAKSAAYYQTTDWKVMNHVKGACEIPDAHFLRGLAYELFLSARTNALDNGRIGMYTGGGILVTCSINNPDCTDLRYCVVGIYFTPVSATE